MSTSYLAFNGVAYLLLGLWCAVAVDRTAASVGFKTLDASGRCEYTAVYGGLQVALGIAFLLTAFGNGLREIGVVFALIVYGGIVPFRLIGLVRFWPVARLTAGFAAFEGLMLVLAIALHFSRT